jgi:hypothetical protein
LFDIGELEVVFVHLVKAPVLIRVLELAEPSDSSTNLNNSHITVAKFVTLCYRAVMFVTQFISLCSFIVRLLC